MTETIESNNNNNNDNNSTTTTTELYDLFGSSNLQYIGLQYKVNNYIQNNPFKQQPKFYSLINTPPNNIYNNYNIQQQYQQQTSASQHNIYSNAIHKQQQFTTLSSQHIDISLWPVIEQKLKNYNDNITIDNNNWLNTLYNNTIQQQLNNAYNLYQQYTNDNKNNILQQAIKYINPATLLFDTFINKQFTNKTTYIYADIFKQYNIQPTTYLDLNSGNSVEYMFHKHEYTRGFVLQTTDNIQQQYNNSDIKVHKSDATNYMQWSQLTKLFTFIHHNTQRIGVQCIIDNKLQLHAHDNNTGSQLLYELAVALHILAYNGTLIVRLPTINNIFTISLLYILYNAFQTITIHNSEIIDIDNNNCISSDISCTQWLICQNFQLRDKLLQHYQTHIASLHRRINTATDITIVQYIMNITVIDINIIKNNQQFITWLIQCNNIDKQLLLYRLLNITYYISHHSNNDDSNTNADLQPITAIPYIQDQTMFMKNYSWVNSDTSDYNM